MDKGKTVDEELDKLVQLSLLYDFYGALLKENHRLIFEDYVLNDMSLGEIAGEQGITRQGVFDVVKRCSSRLLEYEAKLHLVAKFQFTKEKLQEIDRIASITKEDDSLAKICSITKEIYDLI